MKDESTSGPEKEAQNNEEMRFTTKAIPFNIDCPMNGIFYEAPYPDGSPYAHVGQRISQETILGKILVEHIFHELRSENIGEISRIFVKNGDRVELGQPLFEFWATFDERMKTLHDTFDEKTAAEWKARFQTPQ